MTNQIEQINIGLDRNFYFMVALLGIIVNIGVVVINGNQMPVRVHDIDSWESTFKDKPFYFAYEKSSEVKVWLLTDIFNIKDRIVFSFGDIMILIGISLTIKKEFRLKD